MEKLRCIGEHLPGDLAGVVYDYDPYRELYARVIAQIREGARFIHNRRARSSDLTVHCDCRRIPQFALLWLKKYHDNHSSLGHMHDEAFKHYRAQFYGKSGADRGWYP